MKKLFLLLMATILLTSCDNIRSVTYREPVKFKDNIFTPPPGTYAAVRPDVPQLQKNETAELVADSFVDFLGQCYFNSPTVRTLEIKLNGDKVDQNALEQLVFLKRKVDYLIFLSAKYKEPVVTEFNDSRNYRQPREHVTGVLSILDVAQNKVIYTQTLTGSTEDTYDPNDPYGDDEEDILFKAEGGMLTMKVMRRLIKGVIKKADVSNFSCP